MNAFADPVTRRSASRLTRSGTWYPARLEVACDGLARLSFRYSSEDFDDNRPDFGIDAPFRRLAVIEVPKWSWTGWFLALANRLVLAAAYPFAVFSICLRSKICSKARHKIPD